MESLWKEEEICRRLQIVFGEEFSSSCIAIVIVHYPIVPSSLLSRSRSIVVKISRFKNVATELFSPPLAS